MKPLKIIHLALLFICQGVFSQSSPDYKGGLSIKFDEEGKKELRILASGQFQVIYADEVPEDRNNFSFNLRRARITTYAKINDEFLIVTQFGVNNLNENTLSPNGQGESSQLSFIDFYGQYNFNKNHSVGAGLHPYNGISRLNNTSTTTMLTMDNNRPSYATLGLSDQTSRHLGIFAKGNFGNFLYRIAFNETLTNGLDMRTPEIGGSAVYGGHRLLGSKDAGFAYAGYFEYSLFDLETSVLSFKPGTYLGAKKVLTVGTGFFMHPNGSVYSDQNESLMGDDILILGIDTFYEVPVGEKGAALTAYGAYQNNDYGKDYLFLVYGTGSMWYGHCGYLLGGSEKKIRFQPYLSYTYEDLVASEEARKRFGLGINTYLGGSNFKLTLDYNRINWLNAENFITLQAGINL